jgi:hypothetical protein
MSRHRFEEEAWKAAESSPSPAPAIQPGAFVCCPMMPAGFGGGWANPAWIYQQAFAQAVAAHTPSARVTELVASLN